MKTKDIKKKLQSEIDRFVPDVYGNVRKTPINKLLTSETPGQTLQKRLATRILVLVLVIFVVITVAFFGYYTSATQPTGDYIGLSYIQIEFSDGSVQQTYGISADGTGVVLCAYDFNADEQVSTLTGFDISAVFGNFPFSVELSIIQNVKIVVLNDNANYARSAADALIENFFKTYGSTDILAVYTYDSAVKATLISFINARDTHTVSSSDSIDSLASAFANSAK